MGKCVRIRGSEHPSPSPGEAAACHTLRSGRRVPVDVAAAAACSSPGRRHRRGPSACRRCGAKRACSSHGRRKSAETRPPPCGRAVLGSQLSGGRPDGEELPSQASPVARDVDGHRGDIFEPNTPPAGDLVKVKHEHESTAVAGQRMPSPRLEAEMEAFFAVAELAESRRFAEAYNYDVTLDRPLEGRFEWAPMNT